MLKTLRELDPVVHLAFFIAIIFLIVIVVSLRRDVNFLSERVNSGQTLAPVSKVEPIVGCGSECKSEISLKVSQAIATISAVPKVVYQKVAGGAPTPAANPQRTASVALGTIARTTVTDWVDVSDTKVTIDLAYDYSTAAQVTWEAFLKVQDGNGTAYARLFDETNGRAVDGSEISTNANAELLPAVSSKLVIWSGRNTYKVQIKSQTGYEVTYSGGKMKIVY